jgi:hypothetical protein
VAVHVPQLDRPVGARRREGASARAEHDAVDRAGVRPERRSELPPGWRVPQPNHATSACSRNRASVWAERNTIDDADEAPQRPDQTAAAQVPQLNRPVLGGGGEGAPVGTERDAANWAGVTDQSYPNPDRPRAGERPTTASKRKASGKGYGHCPDYQRSFYVHTIDPG